MEQKIERKICEICPHGCRLAEGQVGFCGGRICRGGQITALNYGKVTAIALDPIEKKPLRRFCSGNQVLSVGSFGCNLRCSFCQNHRISMGGIEEPVAEDAYIKVTPEQLTDKAVSLQSEGNIGLAYTYNEPLIGYEFVMDCAKKIKAAGMKNVIVTNGYINEAPWKELLPWVDGVNIDLKSFRAGFYEEIQGSLDAVKRSIEMAAKTKHCHVEITTLIIPGKNDDEDEMEEQARWLASLDQEIPLHISRFFPNYKLANIEATPVDKVYELAKAARRHLKYVYTGNC